MQASATPRCAIVAAVHPANIRAAAENVNAAIVVIIRTAAQRFEVADLPPGRSRELTVAQRDWSALGHAAKAKSLQPAI